MKKSSIYILLFSFLMINLNLLSAQDAQKDLSHMFKQFQEQSYTANMVQSWFPSHTASQAVKVETGEIKVKKDQACYHRLGEVETLYNEQYAMTLNHQMKVMMIQGFNPIQAKKDLLGFDKEAQNYAQYQYVNIDANYAKYVLDNQEGDVSRVEVFFHKNTLTLTKMAYFLAAETVFMEGIEGTEARMEMEFQQLNFNPTFQEKDFSESRFVTKNSNGFQMNSAYRGYRLANYAG